MFRRFLGRDLHRSDPAELLQQLDSLARKATNLSSNGKDQEAIVVCDQMMEQFGHYSNPSLREIVALFQSVKGDRLVNLNRANEAIATFDLVISTYGQHTEAVASALRGKGEALINMGRRQEAIATFDQVIETFGNSSDAALTEIVHMARAAKDRMSLNTFVVAMTLGMSNAHSLLEDGRIDEAIPLFDKVVDEARSCFLYPAPPALTAALEALSQKGIALRDAGRCEEAIDTWSQLIDRFRDAFNTPPTKDIIAIFEEGGFYDDIFKLVVFAFANKVALLSEVNRDQEALWVCTQMIDWFGDSSISFVREYIEAAQEDVVRLMGLS